MRAADEDERQAGGTRARSLGARPARSASTAPEDTPLSHERRSRLLKRVSIALVALVLLLGMVNVLGPRYGTVEARGTSASVRVEYAAVSRPRLATTWAVEIRRADGFPGRIRIATTTAYFRGFDYNALYPELLSQTVRGDRLVLEFAPPPGDSLRVELDARATRTWTFVRRATTTVSGKGLPELFVDHRMLFLP